MKKNIACNFTYAKIRLGLNGHSKAVVAKAACAVMGVEVKGKDLAIAAFLDWARAGGSPNQTDAMKVASEEVAKRKKERLAKKKLKGKRRFRFEPSTKSLGAPHPEYKKDDGFYESRAWRELRYEALKVSGARCRCCGATAANGKRIHVDHVKPRYTHPHLALEITNLQVLCEDCNIGKGAWDSTDWRAPR